MCEQLLTSLPGIDDDFDLVGPCTNCARTSKQCTFEWVQSQQLQRKERQAQAFNNNSNAYTPASRKAASLGPAEAQSVGSLSPTTSNVPLRPLRPSVQTTTAFETPSSVSQPSAYLFSAQQTDHHHQPQQHMLLDATSSPYHATTNQAVFDMPPRVPGVAFVDGSLTTTAPSMDLAGVSCLGVNGMDATQHQQQHQHVPVSAQPPPQPSYMDVSGVLADYGLGNFDTATAAAGGWPSPAVSSSSNHNNHHSNNNNNSNNSNTLSMQAVAAADDTATHEQQVQGQRKRRRTQSPARMSGSVLAASAFSPSPHQLWVSDSRLCRASNGNMIGEMMMRIYHDVMEGALSCWLTEQTCPYNSMPPTPQSMTAIGGGGGEHQPGHNYPQFWGAFEDMQREWGPNWSNRIYRRVVKLDRMAHLLGIRKLRPADESKVSNALNAAVMAFTAQWAQGSQRSSERWPSDLDDAGGDIFRPPDLEDDIGEEFDRTLQKSLWNQARRSLNDCSEIDSFRVVFAEIIFGLTQKYGDRSESAADRYYDTPSGLGRDTRNKTSGAVEEILREDTQQIWLERATRRLHVLRRRVELHDRQLRGREGSSYDAECRKTIDLLFWLAVMFDTISAAMTERPLTISDEDSANLALSHPSHNYNYHQHNNHDSRYAAGVSDENALRWNVILAKDQQTKLAPLQWPCTDQEIAQELTDAAPVKVLLYRKVTRLQSLVARESVSSAVVSNAVGDALMVYAHWQAHYGALFADCIAHHVLLAARTQSWYVCLFGHWLLATLLLADLIEAAAQQGLLASSALASTGATTASATGHSTAMGRGVVSSPAQQQADDIRRSSVRHISDLARASAPRHGDDGLGELDNYHHAVSEGALLTEPWTMILIRTFSRAAIILLESTSSAGREDVGQSAVAAELMVGEESQQDYGDRGRLQRCEDCIKALWYLGRKSDMARQVAQVLAAGLHRARTECGQ